jgi:hypothetical protein
MSEESYLKEGIYEQIKECKDIELLYLIRSLLGNKERVE